VERPAQNGNVILADETMITGKAAMLDIMRSDRDLIRIFENSNIKLSLIIDKASCNTKLDMITGRIYAVISRLIKDDGFSVKTPTTFMALRGTSFVISVEKNRSNITVLSGKVKINPVKEDKIIESVETYATRGQAVILDTVDVEKIAKQIEKNVVPEKISIEIKKLETEDIKSIVEEVKGSAPGTIDRLNEEIKTEIKENTNAINNEENLKKEKEKMDRGNSTSLKQKQQHEKEQSEKVRHEKEKIESGRLQKERADKEEKERQKEKERIEAETKAKKEKDKERAGNVPSF
jgi:hypothetical protein